MPIDDNAFGWYRGWTISWAHLMPLNELLDNVIIDQFLTQNIFFLCRSLNRWFIYIVLFNFPTDANRFHIMTVNLLSNFTYPTRHLTIYIPTHMRLSSMCHCSYLSFWHIQSSIRFPKDLEVFNDELQVVYILYSDISSMLLHIQMSVQSCLKT